jgi:hypothetical protein
VNPLDGGDAAGFAFLLALPSLAALVIAAGLAATKSSMRSMQPSA